MKSSPGTYTHDQQWESIPDSSVWSPIPYPLGQMLIHDENWCIFYISPVETDGVANMH